MLFGASNCFFDTYPAPASLLPSAREERLEQGDTEFPNTANVRKTFMVFRTACSFAVKRMINFEDWEKTVLEISEKNYFRLKFPLKLLKRCKCLWNCQIPRKIPKVIAHSWDKISFLVRLVLSGLEEYHRARARWESGRIIADSTGESVRVKWWHDWAAHGFRPLKVYTLPKTKSSPLKIGRAPKEGSFPTIHFQVRKC